MMEKVSHTETRLLVCLIFLAIALVGAEVGFLALIYRTKTYEDPISWIYVGSSPSIRYLTKYAKDGMWYFNLLILYYKIITVLL